jgi:YD repeat-containing protein
MATAVAALLLLACPRGGTSTAEPTPTPTPAPAPAKASTPAPEPVAATEPGVDPAEGYAPPPAFLQPPTQLDVPWAELVPPADVPVAQRTPLVMPWPAGVELTPPKAPAPSSEPRACRLAHFLPHDTRPLRTVEREHDAEGRVVEERIDDDTDGTIDVRIRYVFGPDGKLARERERFGPQPTCSGMQPAAITETTHRYDAHGVWLGGEVRYDGEVEQGTVWRNTSYDPRGRPWQWIEHQHGAVVRALRLRWDDRDRLTERADYLVAQPSVVERWHYVDDRERYHARWVVGAWTVERELLDPEGRVVVIQRDEDGDGTVDARVERSYDASGREVEGTTDADLDGEAEIRAELRWDTHGRPLSKITTGPKGTTRETWRYDDGGRLLRWSQQRDESWVEDYEEHRYDAHGNELERWVERYNAVPAASDLSSYVTREHWRVERDAEGRLVREHRLAGELGPNEQVEHIYDCRERYRRYPRRNPLDNPKTAAECFSGGE